MTQTNLRLAFADAARPPIFTSKLFNSLVLLAFATTQAFAQSALQQPDVLPEETKSYSPVSISIDTSQQDATILYTLETADGISVQQTYTGAFEISEPTTVRAIARQSGFTDSSVAQKTYHIVTTLDIWGLAESSNLANSPENLVQARTYGNGTIALRNDGTLVHLPSGGDPDPPTGLDDVFAIDAGTDFSLAMRDDGSVAAWGDDEYGQSSIPPDLPPAVSISAGHSSASILTTDGRVRSWGGAASNWNNQPPRNIANVVAFSEGEDYTLGILRDGTVTAWRNGGFTSNAHIPQGLTNVISVVAGRSHNLALKADGTVVAWGGYDDNRIPTVSSWRNIVAIGASYNQSHGLSSNGKILTYAPDSSPRQDDRLDQVVAFDTQHYSGTAIRSSSLDTYQIDLSWNTDRGHVSPSTHKSHFMPNEPLQLLAIPKEGYGFSHWSGDVDSSQNPLNLRIDAAFTIEAVFLPALETPTTQYDPSEEAFELASIDLSTTENFAQLRYTLDGTEPTQDSLLYTDPIQATQSQILRARSFAAGYAPSMELVIPIDIVNVLAYGNTGLAELPTDATNIVSIAASYENAIALRNDGTIASWTGSNDTRTDFEESITDVVAVAAGRALNVVLHSNGTVYSWETSLEREFPTPEGLGQAIDIAATYDSVLALLADGNLAQWSGWLPTIHFTPDTDGNAIAIACGDEHSVALLKDGSVIEWDSAGLREIPDNLPAFKSIAAGREFTIGLTQTGRLISWGRDALGSLRQLPDMSHIIAKGFQAYGITVDGQIRVLAGSPSSGSQQIAELEGVSSLFVGELSNYAILNQPGVSFTPRYSISASPLNPKRLTVEYQIPQGTHYQLFVADDLLHWESSQPNSFLSLSLGQTITYTIEPGEKSKFFMLIAP